MDELIGAEVVVGGRKLTCVGWDSSTSSSGNKIYQVDCNICSQDKELFGTTTFKCSKRNFLKGMLSCGCTGYTKYTYEQYILRVTRVLSYVGFCFCYLKDTGRKKSTWRVGISCKETGVEWEVSLGFVLDKSTVLKRPDQRGTTSMGEDFYNQFVPEGDHITKTGDNLWVYTCGTCIGDHSSSLGLRNNFNIRRGELMSGKKPCRCGTRHKYFDWEKILLLKDYFSQVEDEFIRFKDRKVYWSCHYGHYNYRGYYQFGSNKKCNSCSGTTGLDYNKECTIYLVRWYINGKVGYKFGLTTEKNIHSRFKSTKSKCGGEYEVLLSRLLQTGYMCLSLEKEIKDLVVQFDGKPFTKEVMPDGYTETFTDERLLSTVISRIEKFKEALA